MAAGVLISRILLLCLISDVNHSFAFPSGGHKKGRKQILNYGNRRPLDYIRHLRQPSVNLHSYGLVRTRQPSKNLLRDLSPPSLPLMKTRFQRPHGPKVMFPFQPGPLRNHPSAQPRSLQINVDIPFLNLGKQNENDYIPGFDTEPVHSTDQMQSGSSTPKYAPEKTVYVKDPYQKKTSEVSKSTILFNLSIPLSTSLKPLKSHIPVEKSQTLLSMYVPNQYAEPAKQDHSTTQTGSTWSTFNQATREPMQTGSKRPTYNKVTQEQFQTGSERPIAYLETLQPSQTGSQWPAFNQATQEPVQPGSQWPAFNQAPQEPVQPGSQWPAFNQATQEPVQTGSQWPAFNQATQEPVQIGSKKLTYNKATQEPVQTGSQWPAFNQATQEPMQTGSKKPTYNKAPQEPVQTGSQWPAYNQAPQEPVQTGTQWPAYNQAPQEPVQPGSQWPAFNQAPQEPVQTGSQWPAFNQATQEPVQPGSQWPAFNQATQEPVQTGSQWPAFNQAPQEPMQTGSQWPAFNQAPQEPVQTGSQWPAFNQAPQEPVQTGSQWPAFNQAPQEPVQTGSQWPAFNQAPQEPVQTGSQWPAFNQATQEPVQTGSQWPAFNQATQEPMQTGSKKPTYNKVTQEPVQTGSQWPAFNQATQEPVQTGSQWPAFNQATQEPVQIGSKKLTYNKATQEPVQTGSQWPAFNQAIQEPMQTGSKKPTYNKATQEPVQTGSQWPAVNQATQEPKQTGSQRPAYNRATLEQSQTGSEWPSVNRVVTQHPSQTRSKWPTYNQEKRQPSQIGSQWSTYSKTTQEQSRPNPVRTWQTKEHKNTGNGNLEKPARQPWGLQMQSTRKPSLPILKYFKNSDIYRPQTSLGEKDFVIKPDLSKLKLSSPMQFGSNPSNAEIQGGFGNSGADVKEELMEQEQEQKFSSPTIKLGFTFPVVGKLQNITQSNGGYVFNINPENTGSFSEVAKSLQTGSKWPILSFEAVQQKPNEQTEKKRPHLNFDTILQQNKQPEPVGTPPTSGKPSWNSYQQVNQDNTPSGPSWGVQTSEMNKLQSPVLPVSKYQELIDPEHAHKGPTVQPNPSQPEAVQSQHHNTWVKLGSDDNQSQIRPSGSLTFTIEHDGLFKTPIEPWQTAVDFSKLDASPAIYEAKPPHKWQKPLFPKFYPYNSGQETSQSPTKSPGQDTERNLEGSGKSVKLSITADGAADAVDGQTIFPSHSSHLEFPSKWDAAGTALNLPSSSSSNSEQDSFNLNPPYQSKPQSETIDVARKPQKLEQSYNFQVNYYPSSEKTVSFPSNAFQHVLSGAVPHSIQSLFQTKHNNDQRQQSAKYNQPQNHVPVRSSW